MIRRIPFVALTEELIWGVRKLRAAGKSLSNIPWEDWSEEPEDELRRAA